MEGCGLDSEAKRVYANVFELEASPYDFGLKFGWRDSEQAKTQTSDVQAIVFMSPEHAKAVAAILSKAVADWERQIGKIQMPEIVAADSNMENN